MSVRRQELIEGIIARTGGEVPQYRERLDSFSDEKLEKICMSLDKVIAYGREFRANHPEVVAKIEDDLAEAILIKDR